VKAGHERASLHAWACLHQVRCVCERGVGRAAALRSPKSVANTAWALASLDYHVAACAASDGDTPALNFNAQNLANTTWALTTLGHSDPVFIRGTLLGGQHKLRRSTHKSLATRRGAQPSWTTTTLRSWALCWWLPSQGYPYSQDLANIAWALSGSTMSTLCSWRSDGGSQPEAATVQQRRGQPATLLCPYWTSTTRSHARWLRCTLRADLPVPQALALNKAIVMRAPD
jgi:hypothetical protein